MSLGERLVAHGLVLPAGHALVAIDDRPELRAELGDFNGAVWPEFMLHDAVANTLWDHLYDDFATHQLCLLDADGRIVAGLNAAPLAWDGTDDDLPVGWDDQFRRAVDGVKAGTPPDTLGALQIVVRPDRQGSGYSSVMLAAMRANAASRRLSRADRLRPPDGQGGPPAACRSGSTWRGPVTTASPSTRGSASTSAPAAGSSDRRRPR